MKHKKNRIKNRLNRKNKKRNQSRKRLIARKPKTKHIMTITTMIITKASVLRKTRVLILIPLLAKTVVLLKGIPIQGPLLKALGLSQKLSKRVEVTVEVLPSRTFQQTGLTLLMRKRSI